MGLEEQLMGTTGVEAFIGLCVLTVALALFMGGYYLGQRSAKQCEEKCEPLVVDMSKYEEVIIYGTTPFKLKETLSDSDKN